MWNVPPVGTQGGTYSYRWSASRSGVPSGAAQARQAPLGEVSANGGSPADSTCVEVLRDVGSLDSVSAVDSR